jgi:hypothetical protein
MVPVVQGRIWFPGNPWPDGHRLLECAWTGRLDDAGRLWFDLSLATSDYDENGAPPEDPGKDGDWVSPSVWSNYHSCSLSSTRWEGATGLLAATPQRRFGFTDPRPQRLTADPLPIEDPDAPPAFHVYLLGHDSVAGHEVEFTREDTGRHRIEWTGRIALTYAGDEEFRYEFRAEIRDIAVEYIGLPDAMPIDEARRHLARLVDVPERFVASVVDGHQLLKLVEA